MSTQHTPGPWSLTPRFSDKIDVIHSSLGRAGAASMTVARVTVRETWLAEQEANAHLIAAAPDLLEALQQLTIAFENIGGEHVTGLEGSEQRMIAAYAAIAKATGSAT